MTILTVKKSNCVILALLLMPLGLVSLAKIGPINFRPYQIPLLIGLIVFALNAAQKLHTKIPKVGCALLGLYFTSIICSMSNAEYPIIIIKQLFLATVFSLFFLLFSTQIKIATIPILHKVIIAVCILLCLREIFLIVGLMLGIFKIFDLQGFNYHFYRPKAFFAEGNEFGEYLVFVFGFVFADFVSKQYTCSKKILILFFIVFIPILVLNMSRGSWLGCLASIIVVMILLHKTRLKKIELFFCFKFIFVLVFAIAGSLLIIMKAVPTRFDVNAASVIMQKSMTLFKKDKQETSTMRLNFNLIAFNKMMENPFVGIGFGNVFTIVPNGILEEPSKAGGLPVIGNATTSNFAADLGVELGIFGLLSFLGFLIFIFYSSTKKLQLSMPSSINVFRIGAIASFIGLVVNGMTYATHMLPFIWISAGIAISNISYYNEGDNCKIRQIPP